MRKCTNASPVERGRGEKVRQERCNSIVAQITTICMAEPAVCVVCTERVNERRCACRRGRESKLRVCERRCPKAM